MDQDEARQLLAAERARIERELGRHDGERAGEDDAPQDRADQGEGLFERSLDAGIREQLLGELARLEAAEQRLEDGTYGTSVVSGKPIPDERLRIVPTADRLVGE
ncbi:MAG: hypothetical protein HZB46_03035 [Solirubrobacterales bacterium]|nr:hypothetical protein [Solirubrobacterales bacterium]